MLESTRIAYFYFMYESLLKNAFAPTQLNLSTHEFFFNAWEEVEFKRGDFITEAGRVEKYLYLVIEGVQAIYTLTPKGEKKVIGFSFDGSFSGVYDSFIKANESHYFLEALTPSRMLRMKNTDYERLFEMYPEFNKWGRIAHQELLIGRVQREVELITLTARERFDTFMKRCPDKLLEIPHKMLASYLNMTPETFSRLRGSIS
ncbi:MAG: Crp/Fnr family transcriptional regulator [Crocinitomicaceae bacterium]|nr:Crp/Fnr family transcriptional regulator [Crocinitomicaceae bacterium]